MKWLVAIYVAMSIITGLAYWLDKRLAQAGGRRISERALHLLALAFELARRAAGPAVRPAQEPQGFPPNRLLVDRRPARRGLDLVVAALKRRARWMTRLPPDGVRIGAGSKGSREPLLPTTATLASSPVRCFFSGVNFPALLLGLAACASVVWSAPPKVVKVEPPNWWVSHSLNPVRLLIRGKNLQGATLEGAPGIRVANVAVNAAGTYAFADVRLSTRAKTGPRLLRLTTREGGAAVPFEVLPRLQTEAGFSGFGPDDFIYFLMPDRFANGDAANDDLPKAPGLHDRRKSRHYHGGDLRGVIQRLPYL